MGVRCPTQAGVIQEKPRKRKGITSNEYQMVLVKFMQGVGTQRGVYVSIRHSPHQYVLI